MPITSALKHKPPTNTEPTPIDFTFPAPDFAVDDEAEADAEVVPAAVVRAVPLEDAPPLELRAELVAEELTVIPVTRSGTAGPVV
jgi:hypothetical protein